MSARARRSTHRAFTLIELVMALLVMGIVMGAIGSVFVLSARALPDGQPAASSQDAVAALIQRLSAELQCATSITSAGPTFIEFVTPDRTGDAIPDTIRYSWNGLTTGSVTRALNGAAPGIVLSNVNRFALDYLVRTETVSAATPSAETLLASYDSTASSTVQITATTWRGASVLPSLTAGATSYTITRIAVNLRSGTGLDNTTKVDVRAIDITGVPTGPALASATISGAGVSSSPAWFTATFASPPTLSASSGFAFVVSAPGLLAASKVTTVIGDSAAPLALNVATSSAGLSWSKGGKDIPNFQIYGTVMSATAVPSARRFLTRVNVEAQVTTAGSPVLSGGVPLLNQPEVP